MQIDKDTILQFLRQKGDDQKAAEADEELPAQVDTDEDKGLLDRLGIDVGDLVAAVTGGGGLGDIGKKLGGFLK
jgi:hypothetical protein